MVENMASSTGDILIYDSHTPGGYRFLNHAADPSTISKINSNNWDYVVLQAQSQETSLSEAQMQTEVYPYAQSLSNDIRANNPCSQPMFYMTWGRENGDASNCASLPWVCTYEGMDDAIRATYLLMARTNEAELAPAGAVWRYIRENHPAVALYSGDGSHPSLVGSYAVACAFYTMIYKNDPTTIAWNSTLTQSEANLIKMVAKTVVFDKISNWDFTERPVADFTEVINGAEIAFTNTSSSFDTISWDFGDSNTSTATNPVHTYTTSGLYTVSQTITQCGNSDTKTKNFEITILGAERIELNPLIIYPNPTSGSLNLRFGKAHAAINIDISDISGKSVFTTSAANTFDLNLDTSAFSQGIYLLSIIADNQFYVKKIVKR